MTCTTDERAAHRALVDDVTKLSSVVCADALDPGTGPDERWTTEIVIQPGETIVPPEVHDTLADHGFGSLRQGDRGQPPTTVVVAARGH